MSVVTEPIMLDTTGQAIVETLSQITAMQGPAGQDGAPGADGADGFSPTVTVTTITGGHRITITDASGAHSFDVMDGEGVEEVFLVPMSFYSDGTVDLGNEVTMQDIHDAKEAGKLVVGYSGSTVLFDGEDFYGTSAWEIHFIKTWNGGADYITLSPNRPDGHDGGYTWKALVEEAPSDSKQYARRNGAWSEVQGGSGSSEHIYNVKDYGTVGDGVTDDYDAIMAAVADAKAHPAVGGGTHATVYFPAGRYYVRWGIDIDETAKPISIIGESSASVTITSSASGSLLDLYRTDSGISYGSTVSGLTLQGTSQYTWGLSISRQGQCVIEDVAIYNSHSAATGCGLTVDHSSQVFFSHIQVQGFDTGCYINNPAGYGDVYFSDCRFDGNSTNGFEAYRVSGLYLSNVTMYGNGVTGLVLGHQISGVVSYPFAENVFLNNVVADTSGLMNGALVWADNVMMSNCWFATQMNSPVSSANHGLYIENSSNITITASTFRNNFDNGIYATNSNYISINGCIFRKNGQRSAYTYAVALVACTKITVCGNVFMPDSYQKRGVYIDGCDFFIVANNSLDNTDVPVYSNESTSTTRIIKDNIS